MQSKKSLFLLLIFCMSLVFVSCSEDEDNPLVSDEMYEKLNKVLNDAIVDYSIPGVMGGIWINGARAWSAARGYANLIDNLGMDIYMKARVGEITESLTAVRLLKMAADSIIDLENKLSDYFPQFPNSDTITLKMLLNHSSGLGDYFTHPQIDNILWESRYNFLSKTEVLNAAAAMSPSFYPGTQHSYSHTNPLIAGLIIEQITGRELNDEFHSYFCSVLEMNDTKIPETASLDGNFCNGYEIPESLIRRDASNLHPIITSGAAGLVSSVWDLQKWMKKIMKPEILPVDFFGMMFDYKTGSDGYEYGLGIRRIGDFSGYESTIPGYNTLLFYYPAKKATIILIVNQCSKSGGAARDIFRQIIDVMYPAAEFD